MLREKKTFAPQLSIAAGLAAMLLCASGASATVVFSDDFEDADLDNLGYAIEDVDVNLDGIIGQYTPGNLSFPNPINEVSDPGLPSTGLRWHASQGFTSGLSQDPKSNGSIVNDTPGGLPDSVNINSGLALSLEGKGRATSHTGFFDPTPTPGVANDQRLTLGLNVGDEVKVSFDWRIWESAPNANTPVLPDLAQLRFGLFQDTDHQLGSTHAFAGPLGASSAVWGQENGHFRGDFSGGGTQPGANGDHGWFAKLYIGDEDFSETTPGSGVPLFTGDLNRIAEEVNPNGVGGEQNFLEGSDQDTVASTPDGTLGDPSSFFPLLKTGKVYNIEFSLVRSVAAAFQGDSAGLITATVTVNELDASGAVVGSWSFGDEEDAGDPLNPIPDQDGVQSDVWDYIGFRNSSGDPEQDFDMIIDNLILEECLGGCGAGLVGDLDGDGFVGINDLNIVLANWNQNVPPANPLADPSGDGFVGIDDLNAVLGNWNAGTPPNAGANVPEPASIALLSVGALATLKRRR